MNRRDFTKLSTLAMASTRLSAALAQNAPAAVPTTAPAQNTAATPAPQKPIGIAPVGLGDISTIFMDACANSPSIKITGLVTGHPDTKGAKFAEMYGIPKSSIYTYDTFRNIRDNPDIDALYIGLPNSMHCEYTVRGAEYGKHVLCEKPMAISSAECRVMIEACQKAEVKLMIAYRVQYDPIWQQARTILRAGDIGKVQAFRGSFLASQTAGAWRLNRDLAGGGSLMDLGIYPLNGIRFLTHEEPSAFTAVVATRDKDDPRFTQVEQSVEWTMKLPSGILSSCGSSYGQVGPNFLSIHGDQGYLRLDNAFSYTGVHLTGVAGGHTFDQLSTGQGHYQFRLEAEHFADCVRYKMQQPRTPGDEGLKDLLAIEQIYKAAGTPIA